MAERVCFCLNPGYMTLHRASRAFALALALVAAYGCTGGLSCGSGSGCTNAYVPIPADDPRVPNGREPVDDGVRMRMTQAALDFLADNIRQIIAGALGSDPSNPIIMISQTNVVDIGGGVSLGVGPTETHPYEIYIDGQALSDNMILEFVGDDAGETDAIRVRAANVPVGLDARVFFETDVLVTTATAACDLFGTNGGLGGRPWFTTLTLDMLVKPRVGNGAECDSGQGECLKIDVDVTDASIGSFSYDDLEVDKPYSPCADDGLGDCSEECSDTVFLIDESGDTECVGVCFILDVLVDGVAILAGLVNDLIGGFLPPILEGAIRNALDEFDGSPLAASGRLDLAAFAPGVLPDSALDVGYGVGPTAGAFDVNDPANTAGAQGMDIIFKSLFEAAPSLDDPAFPVPHPCAKIIAGADFSALYGGFRFEAPNAEPLTGVYDGAVYHLGASLAEDAVNQLLFGVYNSGALCLELSTDSVHQLTGGAFPVSAGLVDVLTGGKLRQYAAPDAPVIIALNPSQPPIITYGAGTDTEGHLIIDWPKVEVSFYVLMNERFARVFAVEADIDLQMTVFNEPGTSTLHIGIIDGPNIGGFVETYNELLPGVAFTEVLEGLIGTLFDAALGDGLAFDFDVGPMLSDALGAPIYVQMLGIETIPVGDPEFLNVYLQLTNTEPNPMFAHTPPVRVLEREPLDLPTPEARARALTDELRLQGVDPDLEYLAQIDFGAWRGPFKPDGDELIVRDPKLRLVGHHKVTLRARDPRDINSLDPVGTVTAVWIDPEAPRVSLAVKGTDVVADGTDAVVRAADLSWQWQLDDGEWSAPSSLTRRPVDDLDARRVAVRAVDLAGNVSHPAALDLTTERRRLDAEAGGGPSFGCAQAGDAAWLGALALAVFGAVRRRRPPSTR
ncbi:MAG: hypothetical protein HYS27_00075 [Deltaproteobacteria bacterium]|nr:hypothetical protein [Deltaproteobacteria bacterium]